MKTVICRNNRISYAQNALGQPVPYSGKPLKKDEAYKVTGEVWLNNVLYYILMGFGIKTFFRADKFADV